MRIFLDSRPGPKSWRAICGPNTMSWAEPPNPTTAQPMSEIRRINLRSKISLATCPRYISDNTDDELSHAAFLNAYLKTHGAEPVDLDQFRTLPGSTATGVDKTKVGKRLISSWFNPVFATSAMH